MSSAGPPPAPRDVSLIGALDAEGFAALSGVSRETLARLEAYAALLAQWNERINLVSRDSLRDPWRRHFLDSAQLLAYVPASTRSLVDLGSGAGFPGLVIAAAINASVTLVEARRKRAPAAPPTTSLPESSLHMSRGGE